MSEKTGLKGKAITVLGVVDKENLGFTHPHEHLLIDMSVYFSEPSDAAIRELSYQPVSLENLGWVRYNTRLSVDCGRLTDENIAIQELTRFKSAGGDTLVDLTTKGIGRNPDALARISEATGVNVIMGTGYYVAASHPEEISHRGEEEIAKEFISEIKDGAGEARIRAGIIGEIGCSWPLGDGEKKVLRAAALAQQETGVAINVHPSRNEKGPLEALEVLHAAGARLDKVVISHMDRCGYLLDTRLKILDYGAYVEYDVFGKEGYYPSEAALADGHFPDMPNDVGRIKQIIELIELGYRDRILISQDTCLKIDLRRWGGPGYAHIIENVIPLMKVYGLSNEQINVLTVKNTGTLLCVS